MASEEYESSSQISGNLQIRCNCGDFAKKMTSRTSKNPNKMFWACPNYNQDTKCSKCGFFCWDSMTDIDMSAKQDTIIRHEKEVGNMISRMTAYEEESKKMISRMADHEEESRKMKSRMADYEEESRKMKLKFEEDYKKMKSKEFKYRCLFYSLV